MFWPNFVQKKKKKKVTPLNSKVFSVVTFKLHICSKFQNLSDRNHILRNCFSSNTSDIFCTLNEWCCCLHEGHVNVFMTTAGLVK